MAIAATGEAAAACGDKDAPGKKVALVLSGGGALAASQVGAIKALEEAGVPVHCIVGTSMGAVVGALYASGYDADKLTRIFVDADWGTISTGAASYRDQGFRTKEDQRDFLSDYVFGFSKDGLELPTGLSSLRGMRSYLRNQIELIAHETDFDRLPIPFRAIATDLNTGEAVSLGHGDLVSAALASMAVPGLYPSQQIDGRTLVDGGMSKQVPIDIAREMGADIIIVVDTTLPPPKFDRAPSVIDTVMQLVNLQVWRNRQEQIKQLGPDDILIMPDMTGYSTSGFDRLNEGFDVGYAAAVAANDKLMALAAVAAPKTTHPSPPPQQFVVSSVNILDASGIQDSLIKERLDIAPGDVVTRADIDKGVKSVASLGTFDVVDYLVSEEPGGTRLDINTVPNGEGNQHIQLGTRLSTTLDGDAAYEILGRWSFKPLNSSAGEFNITGELGTNIGIDLELVQPFGPAGRYFVETGLSYQLQTVPVNIDDVRIAERRDATAKVRLLGGRELGQWGIASVGAFAVDLNSDIRVGDTFGLGAQSGTYVGLSGRFAADTLNASSFPTRGLAADLNVYQYWNSEDDREATSGTLTLATANPVGGIGTFIRYDGAILDQEAEGLPNYTLGGFKRLSGFEDNSIPATAYNLLRLEAFTRLGADVEASFGVPIFVGATLEAANAELKFLGSDFDNDFYAGSLYAAVKTPIGPAYAALGIGEAGRKAIYLYLGRAF